MLNGIVDIEEVSYATVDYVEGINNVYLISIEEDYSVIYYYSKGVLKLGYIEK